MTSASSCWFELYPAKTIGVWMHAYEQNLLLAQVEQQYFGVDHAQIGQEWLNRHKFQRTVRYVTAYHEDPKLFRGPGEVGQNEFDQFDDFREQGR